MKKNLAILITEYKSTFFLPQRYKQYFNSIDKKDRRSIEDNFIGKMGWGGYAPCIRFLFKLVQCRYSKSN